LLGRVGKSCRPESEYQMSANNCNSVLCSELAVKLINEPFIKSTDDKEEWAL
jgi:hypothetical protein